MKTIKGKKTNYTSDKEFFISDKKILEAKKAMGQNVSVVLPTFNEEKTLGAILDQLTTKRPILDEIIVVDNGSTDKTPEIALSRGVKFVQAADKLRELGFSTERLGKGANLWLSQLITSETTILVYLDGDQQNFNPNIVNLLLYPLLTNPKIMMVKSLYDRVTKINGGFSYGGRLTQYTVRPLLSFLFPHLRKFLQPINGNCAVRRAALETISFGSQYEADLQILLETAKNWGIDSITQLYAGKFLQDGQDDHLLQRVAFQHVWVLLDYANRAGVLTLHQKLDQEIKIMNEVYFYTPRIFPPVLSIEKYRKRFATKVILSNSNNLKAQVNKIYEHDLIICGKNTKSLPSNITKLFKNSIVCLNSITDSLRTTDLNNLMYTLRILYPGKVIWLTDVINFNEVNNINLGCLLISRQENGGFQIYWDRNVKKTIFK